MNIVEFAVTVSNAGDMSQATLTSNAIDVSRSGLAAVQANWTATPTGALKLQASNDGTNWADLSFTASPAGAAGSAIWNLADIGYPKVRVFYTSASGTGTLTVTANLKNF